MNYNMWHHEARGECLRGPKIVHIPQNPSSFLLESGALRACTRSIRLCHRNDMQNDCEVEEEE
jgi:hypothetical protein